MLRTNDNCKLLTLGVVASLWGQAATTSFHAASASPMPSPPTQAAAANVSPDAPAQAAPPPQILPPLLPGQTGATYEDCMKIGEQAYINKTYAMSVDNFRAAIRFKPTSDAHLGLGLALEQSGMIDDAIAQYFEALKLNTSYAPARNALGNLLMKKESWDEAAGQFLQVLAAQPGDLSARGNLGICYEQKGQYDSALEQFKYIVAVSPKYFDAHYNLGVAYEFKGDWDAAIAEYKKALQLDPKHSMTLIQIAHCYLNKGDYITADKVLKFEIRLHPRNFQAYIALGRIFEVQKKDKEASDYYRKAILIAPKAPECERLQKNMMKKRAIELGLPILPGLQ